MSRRLGGQKVKRRIMELRTEMRADGHAIPSRAIACAHRGDLRGELRALEVGRIVALVRDMSILESCVVWL